MAVSQSDWRYDQAESAFTVRNALEAIGRYQPHNRATNKTRGISTQSD